MKKLIIPISILLIIVSANNSLSATGLDYGTTQSIEQAMMGSRNAATSGADIAHYNPAGTAWLENGLHVNIGNMFANIYFDIKDDYTFYRYKSDSFVPLIPQVYAIFKKEKISAFLAFNVIAGGGSVSFNEGVPDLDYLAKKLGPATIVDKRSSYFRASSMYLAGTLGIAYAINEYISLALSGRMVWARKTNSIRFVAFNTATSEIMPFIVDSAQRAIGFSGIGSVNIRPVKNLTMAVTCESNTIMRFETHTRRNDIGLRPELLSVAATFIDGRKQRRDLPLVLRGGIALRIIADLELSVSGTWQNLQLADVSSNDGVPDKWENGYDLAFGGQYTIIKEIDICAGYNYSRTGGNTRTYNTTAISPDFHLVGGGFISRPIDRLQLKLGGTYIIYNKNIKSSRLHNLLAIPYKQTLNKGLWGIGICIEYRAL